MKISNIMKNNFICNCLKTDYKTNNFTYWESKNVTSDELDIIEFLEHNYNLNNKDILHIGIGNSYFSKKFPSSNNIYGITISNKEIEVANKLNLKNYYVYFCDKYSKSFKEIFINIKFDFIIDANLKSYSCCDNSFNFFIENLCNFLKKGGIIITSRKGMKWYKKLLPKLSFNLKNLFHYKLKEVNGDPKNIMTIEETNNLCKKYSLELFYNDKVCSLKK